MKFSFEGDLDLDLEYNDEEEFIYNIYYDGEESKNENESRIYFYYRIENFVWKTVIALLGPEEKQENENENVMGVVVCEMWKWRKTQESIHYFEHDM